MAPQGSQAPLEFGGPLGNGAKKGGAANPGGAESEGFEGYRGQGAVRERLERGAAVDRVRGAAGGGCCRESAGGDEAKVGKVQRRGAGRAGERAPDAIGPSPGAAALMLLLPAAVLHLLSAARSGPARLLGLPPQLPAPEALWSPRALGLWLAWLGLQAALYLLPARKVRACCRARGAAGGARRRAGGTPSASPTPVCLQTAEGQELKDQSRLRYPINGAGGGRGAGGRGGSQVLGVPPLHTPVPPPLPTAPAARTPAAARASESHGVGLRARSGACAFRGWGAAMGGADPGLGSRLPGPGADSPAGGPGGARRAAPRDAHGTARAPGGGGHAQRRPPQPPALPEGPAGPRLRPGPRGQLR